MMASNGAFIRRNKIKNSQYTIPPEHDIPYGDMNSYSGGLQSCT